MGASLAERVRYERFASLTDADLGAIAYDHGLPASPPERRVAAEMLAARNRDHKAALRRLSDVELARIAIDRRRYDRMMAVEALAERILDEEDDEA